MSREHYHHGNLKEALIEAGLQIIREEGVEQLSLRKVAARCQVSHAAPYNHFQDKEALILAIREYIIDSFSNTLEHAVSSCKDRQNILVVLGETYVDFFVQNPVYYYFLIDQDTFELEIRPGQVRCLNFRPFEIFVQAAESLEELDGEDMAVSLIAMWSVVEGLTSIFVSRKVTCSYDYRELVRKILMEKIRL